MIVIACYAMPMLILVWASLVKVYQAPSLEALEPGQSAKLFPHLRQSASAAERDQHSDAHGDRADARGLHRVLRQLVLGKAQDALGRSFCDNAHGRSKRRAGACAISDLRLTPIHGSIWVLIIAHIVAHLPFTTRVLSAALLQLHKELEEAARVTGATTARTLRTITVPLILPAVVEWLAMGFFRNFARFYFCHFSHDGSKHGVAFSDVGSYGMFLIFRHRGAWHRLHVRICFRDHGRALRGSTAEKKSGLGC